MLEVGGGGDGGSLPVLVGGINARYIIQYESAFTSLGSSV